MSSVMENPVLDVDSISELIDASSIDSINHAISSGLIDAELAGTIIEEKFSDEYVWTQDDECFVLKQDAFYCQASEEYYASDRKFITVIESIRYGSVRQSRYVNKHNDTDYFTCDRSGLFFDSNIFNYRNIEGEYICFEYYEDDLFYWDSDDRYHWEEESCDEECSNIPDYHDSDRPRSWSRAAGYGLELEIWVDCPETVHDKLPEGFLGEKDGSICDVHGIEIIAPPIPFKAFYINNSWSAAMDMLNLNDASVPSAGYGLHVNISHSLFSGELHRAKFIVAMNKLESLGKLIARRETIYNGKYHANKTVNKYTVNSTDKYEPVYVKNYCMEVRIFKSTDKYEDLLVAIEYCEAVKELTRACSIVDLNNINRAELMLFDTIKKNVKKYRNLKTFLESRILLH